MRKLKYLGVACLLTTATANAAVIDGFTGYYDVSNWTASQLGNLEDYNVDTTTLAGAVDTTPDDGLSEISLHTAQWFTDKLERDTTFTISAEYDSTVSFNWDYYNYDFEIGWDSFGILNGGVFTEIWNAGDNSGTYSFDVAAGTTFGFIARSLDSLDNGADIFIDNFEVTYEEISNVPVPAAAWLFGSALLGFAGYRRKAAKKAA